MGSNVRDLWQVQAGQEATRGTAVTPTAKLAGVTGFTISPIEESLLHEELRGTLAPGYHATQVKQAAQATLELALTYQHVLYVLQALFDAVDPPTGSDPYTWAYAAPVTSGAGASPQPFTLVYGDGNGGDFGYGIFGALVSELTIAAESGGAATLSASLLGANADEHALADLSDTAVEFVMGHHFAVYMDDWDATIGATELADVAWSFELTVTPNRANKFHLGSISPTGWRDTKWSGSLRLMLELTNGASPATEALLADLLTASPLKKQVRLLATSGDNRFQIDFAGAAVSAPELFGQQEGVQSLDLELSGLYNPTLGNWLLMQAVNGIASLT